MKINLKTISQFATLSFGSLFSLLINTGSLIVFSRIYTKSNFGSQAIFVSITSILAIFTTLRLEHLIVLKKTTLEAAKISEICKKLITYSCMLIAIIIIVIFLFFKLYSSIWLLLPVGTYCLSGNTVLICWNNKIKNYKLISYQKVIQSSLLLVSGVLLSKISKENGLILAYVISSSFSFLFLNKHYKAYVISQRLKTINWNDVMAFVTLQKKYIKSCIGLDFLSTTSRYIPNFILSFFYGNEIVGVYDMTLKVLNIPKNIISLNIGELYYQKAAVFYQKNKIKFKSVTKQTLINLFFLGILCYIPFLFYGKEMFVLVLGDKWKVSGEISEIIAIWFVFLFISSPMAYVYYIKQSLEKLLTLVLISFLIKSTVLLSLSYLQLNNVATILNYIYVCIILEIILNLFIIKDSRR